MNCICGKPLEPNQIACPECLVDMDRAADLLDDRDGGELEDASEEDMDRWARAYDDRDGAPENDEDR